MEFSRLDGSSKLKNADGKMLSLTDGDTVLAPAVMSEKKAIDIRMGADGHTTQTKLSREDFNKLVDAKPSFDQDGPSLRR